MPYVEGESLPPAPRRETQLPLDDALAITRQVAGALAYAHSHDVVHAISNQRTSCSRAAKRSSRTSALRGRSRRRRRQTDADGIRNRTPLYMSPEQQREVGDRRPQRPVQPGVRSLRNAPGHPPFFGGRRRRSSLVTRWIPSHHFARRATVSGAVEQALDRALAKSPADRYPTVLQFGRGVGRLGPVHGAAAGGGSRRCAPCWGVASPWPRSVPVSAPQPGRAPAPRAAVNAPPMPASVRCCVRDHRRGKRDEYFSDV